jgi:hypothetical protein
MEVLYTHYPKMTGPFSNFLKKPQDLGLLAKCACIMCTTIVYRRTANFLVCLVCQKLANFTFISNSRVKTSKLTPDEHIFSVAHRDLLVSFFSFFFI